MAREPPYFALRLSGGEPEPERRPLLGLDVDVAEDDMDLFGGRVQERSIDGSQVVFSCNAVTRVFYFFASSPLYSCSMHILLSSVTAQGRLSGQKLQTRL